MRRAVLGILCEHDATRAAIRSTLQHRLGDLMEMGPDQICGALDGLHASGLASVRSGHLAGKEDLYSVTAAGRKEFQTWLLRSIARSRPPGDDVFLQLLLLPSADQRVIGLVIEEERRAVLSLLSRRGEAKRQFAKPENWGHRLFTDLLIISALFQSEAALSAARRRSAGPVIKVNFRQAAPRRRVIYG